MLGRPVTWFAYAKACLNMFVIYDNISGAKYANRTQARFKKLIHTPACDDAAFYPPQVQLIYQQGSKLGGRLEVHAV